MMSGADERSGQKRGQWSVTKEEEKQKEKQCGEERNIATTVSLHACQNVFWGIIDPSFRSLISPVSMCPGLIETKTATAVMHETRLV